MAGTKRLTVVAIALGVLVLVFVPVHTLVRADARVLADDDYVEPACRFPFPVIPEPICPRFVAGESPLTLIYVLIGVPLLARGARPGPLLVLSIASAGLAGLQLAAPVAFTFSPADGGPRPSPFEADPGCGLVAWDRRDVSAAGGLGWLLAEGTETAAAEDREKKHPYRMSMVCEKRDGRWFLVQVHGSSPQHG